MVLDGVEFRQVQKATSLPIGMAGGVKVTLWDDGEQTDYIFVSLSDFWVRIDLSDKTFSVGEYEG